MKYSISQGLVFLGERRAQRNIRALSRFIGVLLFLVALYSVLFHFIML